MQLQQNLHQFTKAGIAVFAISYDPVEAQAAFAEEFGITYALLSDADHQAIEATGILNTLSVPEAEIDVTKVAPFPVAEVEERLQASTFGIPYPGSYLIGHDGTVIEKLFYRHYRTRASAATVLLDGFGVDFEVRDHPRAEVGADGVRIRATLGTEAMVYMETSTLYIEIDLDDGLHLYGQPTPPGYVATEVTVTGPDSVEVGAPVYPATTAFRVAGLPEQFHVFQGDLRVAVPVYYVQEHFDHLLARARFLAARRPEHEATIVRQLTAHAEATRPPRETEVRLDVAIRFQACSDVACFPPQTRTLRLDVPIAAVHMSDRSRADAPIAPREGDP